MNEAERGQAMRRSHNLIPGDIVSIVPPKKHEPETVTGVVDSIVGNIVFINYNGILRREFYDRVYWRQGPVEAACKSGELP